MMSYKLIGQRFPILANTASLGSMHIVYSYAQVKQLHISPGESSRSTSERHQI